MPARRQSTRLAMAVSSILAAPAIATGIGLVAGLALAPEARAQETTSAIRVTLYAPDGSPVTGQTVSITDTRTGSTRSAQTNESGLVSIQGLSVGGPYTLSVVSSAYAGQTVTDISLRLGETFDISLKLGSSEMQELVVTAQRVQTEQLALGPSSVFAFDKLQDLPHINRDLRDVVRTDARIYVDPAYAGGAVQCAGANPRFNSLTVDGVRLNDLFGLNSTGYPTERQPFSYDSIQQVAVELAPFDVVYGQFTACNINAVTRSGSNEWHGSVFYDYTSDSLKGDKLEGEKVATGNYTEKRYGGTFSGPIVKDKLFFFLSYEKLDGSNLFDRVPTGAATSGRVIQGVSQEQLDEIYQIAREIYDYTPGDYVSSLPVEDEKVTVKLDWEISDSQRATFAYNYNDGFNWSESDSDDNEFEFSDHYYERGAELNSYTGALFSNWTERFSTEVRLSYLDIANRQISRAGGDFPEVQIKTLNDADGDGAFSSATVYLGTDDSRQTNQLSYEAWNLKLAGRYSLGDHLLTFGLERDELDIFNLFIQHTEMELRYDEECNIANPNGCIETFRELRPDDIYYGNAVPTNDPRDGAAEWGYRVNTAYLQDEWVAGGGDLTLVFGLRYDGYEVGDKPSENPFFFDRNGYSNTATLDGEGLLQPRLGFTYNVDEDLSIRGGVGLYSGGNPNVWLSNNYSNDGFRIAQLRETLIERDPPRGCGEGVDFRLDEIPTVGDGRPAYDIPECLYDAIATQNPNSSVNALDPKFKLPKNWKFAVGFSWTFADDYLINGDLLYTKAEDSAIIVGSTMTQTGEAPDGRPIYTDSRAFNTDYILTNVKGKDAESKQFAINLSKSYENGLNWSIGYAYTDARDVSPMTSSVAFSNYANVAVSDPNDPGLATSNYEIPHRFTFELGYSAYWWADNRTSFTLFGARSQGRPYSYTFAGAGDIFGDFVDDRHLLYVPTGPDDPLVVFADTFNQDAFFSFVQSSGLEKYAGGIAPRNAFNSSWWTVVDLKVEQELPGFREGHKSSAWVVIKNFCNLLDDNACVLREAGFPRTQPIVEARLSQDRSQYVFDEFLQGSGQGRVTDPSAYEIRVGFTYRF
jgi:outer membrane receptor for ferrienterochelin and colicin